MNLRKKLLGSFLMSITLGGAISSVLAVDLREAKIQQVVNDVSIIPAGTEKAKAARVNDTLKSPDLIRTGKNSRTELLAADQTVTRVGANTIFSFEPAGRKINLQQGSILFYSPSGKGGGVIQTAAATAAVTGSTMIVSTTKNGGFKAMNIESGHDMLVRTKFAERRLKPGQLVFVLPDGHLSPILVFRLKDQVNSAMLVQGFNALLGSQPLISKAIEKQEKLIASGDASDEGKLIGDDATAEDVEMIESDIIGELLDRNTRLLTALGSDITIDQGSLGTYSSNIFGAKDFDDFQKLGLQGFDTLINNSDGVLAARNITFNPGLSTNITPGGQATDFGFAALRDIVFKTDTVFVGFGTVSIAAGNEIKSNFATSGQIKNIAGDFYMGARTITLINTFIYANNLVFAIPSASNSFSDFNVLPNSSSPSTANKINVYNSFYLKTGGPNYSLSVPGGPNGVNTAIGAGHLKIIGLQ